MSLTAGMCRGRLGWPNTSALICGPTRSAWSDLAPLDQKTKISARYFNMCDSGGGVLQGVIPPVIIYAERTEGYAR